jgi:hypothetical protein
MVRAAIVASMKNNGTEKRIELIQYFLILLR